MKQFGRGFSVPNLERMRSFFVRCSNSSSELKNSDVFQKSSSMLSISTKARNENPTIGIVLSKVKNQAVLEITLPKDNKQIFVSQYQTILPSKESLKELLNQYKND